MAVSSRTAKILWGKAGATCSFPGCQRRLVADATELNGDVVLGEIAHIVAQNQDGPRGEYPAPGGDVDAYENLILLCGQHHTLIDGQPNTYTVDRLLQMKRDHEEWVSEQLSSGQHLQLPGDTAHRDEAVSESRLRVFLCHSSSDKPAVRHLYQILCADDIEPWLAEEKLLPGQDWHLEITKAVRAAHAVVVCLSHSSIRKTGYVQEEIKYALNVADEQPEGTIFIIPLRLEECEVPDQLRRWQRVDLFKSGGYDLLVRALQSRAQTLGLVIPTHDLDRRLVHEFDKKLQRVRKARGLSIAQLAKYSGISRRALLQMESGYAKPSIGIALKIAAVFGMSLSELAEITVEETPDAKNSGDAV